MAGSEDTRGGEDFRWAIGKHRDHRGCQRLPRQRQDGVHETAYTLYNARPRTVRAAVLKLPHRDGAVYTDAWHGREISSTREGRFDVLNIEIGPMDVGCIAVE